MSRPFNNHRHRRSHKHFRSNSYIRRLTGLGKFQGEDVTSVFAYSYSMESTDTCSHDDGGSNATLVEGPFRSYELSTWRGEFEVQRDRVCGTNDRMNRAERRFIKQQAGCIVHESGDGFVYVTWFGSESILDKAWENIQEYYYGDDESGEE